MRRIFISYSHKDKQFVELLVRDLAIRIPDVEVWYDRLITPGASWAKVLSKAIESADAVIAVLSPDYFASNWAQEELQVGMLRATERKSRLIPVLHRPCKITGMLAALSYADFTKDYESGLNTLIWGITGEKPVSTEGSAPGEAPEDLDSSEVQKLRKELKEAVRLFKSQPPSPPADSSKPERGDSNKAKCFVVMPFGEDDLEVVYEDFVKPVIITDCSLECERGDDVFGSNVIMDDIISSINSADIVVADLTRKNANVFYEVGIYHAVSKPVLLLAQSIDDVPFDLRHRRVLLYEYSPRGCKKLESALKDNILAMISGS